MLPSVEGKKDSTQKKEIRPRAPALGVIGLETLSFYFFNKEKFLSLRVPPKAWKHGQIIPYEAIHIFESAGSLKNSPDAENGSIL